MNNTEDDGYTPGTNEVRAAWIGWFEGTSSWHANEFDRWLKEHDRQVAESAWELAVTAVQRLLETADLSDEEVSVTVYNIFSKDIDNDGMPIL